MAQGLEKHRESLLSLTSSSSRKYGRLFHNCSICSLKIHCFLFLRIYAKCYRCWYKRTNTDFQDLIILQAKWENTPPCCRVKLHLYYREIWEHSCVTSEAGTGSQVWIPELCGSNWTFGNKLEMVWRAGSEAWCYRPGQLLCSPEAGGEKLQARRGSHHLEAPTTRKAPLLCSWHQGEIFQKLKYILLGWGFLWNSHFWGISERETRIVGENERCWGWPRPPQMGWRQKLLHVSVVTDRNF